LKNEKMNKRIPLTPMIFSPVVNLLRSTDPPLLQEVCPPSGAHRRIAQHERAVNSRILGYVAPVSRIAVLASGSGTILQAMLEADLPIVAVVVDRPCGATEIADAAGVTVERVLRTSFGSGFDRVAYTHQVVDALTSHDVDLVAMAGFGTILAKPLHDAFPDRVVNTHPALLPAFKGWHAVEDALAAGVQVTGCTVHLAGVEVDDGPILAQEAVPVLPGDTVESLHERIKTVERRLYPEVLRKIVEEGRRA
jgi:phosphoribosylglycinamide formyltransferase-1